jgi:Raf kinase inhibitor-like YbhB/YbcL family protein
MFGMDKQLTFIILLVTIFGLGVFFYFLEVKGIDISRVQVIKMNKQETMPKLLGSIIISSSAFKNGGQIPLIYSCKGKNINPPLQISETPTNTKSLALILEDPDAPIGTFDHWVVYNIPPETKLITEGQQIPKALYGQNSVGKGEYTGPCPPRGTHRYIFTIYAIDTVLTNDPGLTKKQLKESMKMHIIDESSLTGVFTTK